MPIKCSDCGDRCRKLKMSAGKAALLVFTVQTFIIVSVFAISKAVSSDSASSDVPGDRPYKGRLIGTFGQPKRKEGDTSPITFKVAGSLYAVDEQLLYIHGFIYDGGISGMQLWGIIRDNRTRKETVFIIPTTNECTSAPTCAPLSAVWNENTLIALPRHHTFDNLTEIAVGTRNPDVLYPQIRKKYASVPVPPGFQYPRPVILPTQLGHSLIAGGVSSGKIVVQDSRRIYIEKVTFDGSGSGAFFWVDRSYLPTPNGFMVAPNADETPPQPLQRLPKEPLLSYDALLDLRRAYRPGLSGNIQFLTVFELKSVAIYDRQYETVFGDAPFDGAALKSKIPPALDDLTVNRISEKANSLLRDLQYHIGINNGIQVRPLPTYPRTPPPGTRIHLAAATSGELLNDDPAIQFSKPLPPLSGNISNTWNCEILDDTVEVQWRVQMGFITITVSVPLNILPNPVNTYLAFGISGSQKRSQMIGSDVTLGYLSGKGLQLVDFVLGERIACNSRVPKVDAVCPRSMVGGKQVTKLVGGGGVRDGKLSFSYRRPLETPDILGKDIPMDFPVYVVWSIGPINSATHLPGYHFLHSNGSSSILFGRLPQNNCESPKTETKNHKDAEDVPPQTTGFQPSNESFIPIP